MVLLAAVLWGTTGASQAMAPAGAAPPAIGAARLAVGGLALLVLAWRKDPNGFRRWVDWNNHPAPDLPGLKPLALPILLAAICMAGYQLAFFAAVRRTGVAVGTVVAIGSAPVLTGALAYLFQRQSPPDRWWPATLLAIAGCGLLFLPGGGISIDIAGVMLALGAGFCYAAFAVLNKRLLSFLPPDLAVALIFCLAAVCLLPVWFIVDMRWLLQLRGVLVALHLGLLATAAAYALFARGLQRIPAPTAVTLSLAEPLTAAALGLTMLGERLTLPMTAGVLLILTGLSALAIKY